MKVSIFVRNKSLGPSCAYRICKYIDDTNQNINISQYSSDKSYSRTRKLDKHSILQKVNKVYLFFEGTINRLIYIIKDLLIVKPDTVVIQREIFPKHLPIFAYKILSKYLDRVKTVIWDFDDNIRANNEISEREYNLLCEKSNHIIVSTEFLKTTIPDKFKYKCKILHTTDHDMCCIDLDNINKNRLLSFNKEVYLIWVGTFSNIKYLRNIIPYLDKAAEELNKNNKILTLRVVSNGRIELKTKYLKIENIEWGRKISLESMIKSHIGLMPLESNQYTLGKAGFKAVQYIGMGLPTIVSDVGFNRDVISNKVNGFVIKDNKEWVESILSISNNYEIWISMSEKARDTWKDKFNSDDINLELQKLIFN